MTYGLVPRATDGLTYWDDPTGPVPEVVRVSPPSKFSFPNMTPASVSISRDYLQDYLTLRKMVLVESYWELRYSPSDSEIDERLGGRQFIDLDTPDRRLRLFRMPGGRIVFTEGSGARVVAFPGPPPISNNALEREGLIWPGFQGPITHARAMGSRFDYVYVDDRVLGDYEGRSEFAVHPESGAVSFGTQWAVSHCTRVGRNLIRIELKKLYEGVPAAVTRNWHRFAVNPLPSTAYPAALDERHIGKRAKALTYAYVALGEELAALAHAVGRRELAPGDFTGLRRDDLDYQGWWAFPLAGAIARHVPLNMPVDAFLDRCLSVNKLLVEGLVERSLRVTLHAMGVPETATKGLGTIKLLDCIVRLCQVTHASGLNFATAGSEIWDRLSRERTDPDQPIPRMFALYNMRILKAHRSEDHNELAACLRRFGSELRHAAAGYGVILDRIYDSLITELNGINEKIEAVL
jgi:hypothetical protein